MPTEIEQRNRVRIDPCPLILSTPLEHAGLVRIHLGCQMTMWYFIGGMASILDPTAGSNAMFLFNLRGKFPCPLVVKHGFLNPQVYKCVFL